MMLSTEECKMPTNERILGTGDVAFAVLRFFFTVLALKSDDSDRKRKPKRNDVITN